MSGRLPGKIVIGTVTDFIRGLAMGSAARGSTR